MKEKLRIMVVDDNPISRKIIRLQLKNIANVEEVATPQKCAIKFIDAVVKKQYYDIICLDIRMPVMDGKDVLTHIKDYENDVEVPEDKKVKVIMTTALDDPKNVMKSIHIGCNDYLIKPIAKITLLESIIKVLTTAL